MINVRTKFFSELLGTFGLVFCGAGAIVVNQMTGAITHFGVAVLFGMIVAAMIISFGSVSGSHINPAVSLAFFVIKKIHFLSSSIMWWRKYWVQYWHV